MLASLVGFLGDFDKAEDAVQEAFAIAAERWPASGFPNNPGAWLVTTARNRAIDRIRRERTLTEKLHLLPLSDTIMDDLRRHGHQGRAARADLHLLPSGIGAGRAGGAHAARPRRPANPRYCKSLSGLRGDHETPPVARQAKIKAAGIPFAVPDEPPDRAARCGACRHLPDLQRGLPRARRPGRRSDPAGTRAREAHAGSA